MSEKEMLTSLILYTKFSTSSNICHQWAKPSSVFPFFIWCCIVFYTTHLRPNVSFLYPLKTSEKLWFFNVSRGHRKKPLTWNGLLMIITSNPITIPITEYTIIWLQWGSSYLRHSVKSVIFYFCNDAAASLSIH